MIKTHRINNTKKAHNTVSDKRGFTLVELTVVMALVAILMVMIVSFSTMMGDFAGAEESEYAFLEDVSALKETLSDWVAENDVEGNVFSVSDSGVLSFNGSEVDVSGSNLRYGGETMKGNLDEIASVYFETDTDTKVIKCTVTGTTSNNKISFVIALRSATVQQEVDDE